MYDFSPPNLGTMTVTSCLYTCIKKKIGLVISENKISKRDKNTIKKKLAISLIENENLYEKIEINGKMFYHDRPLTNIKKKKEYVNSFSVNLWSLANALTLDLPRFEANGSGVFYIECYRRTIAGYVSKIVGIPYKKPKKFSSKRDKETKIQGFSNSMTINFKMLAGNVVSVKIYKNGHLSFTGLKTKEQIFEISEALENKLTKLNQKMFSDPICINSCNIRMITYSFHSIDPYLRINNTLLRYFIQENPQFELRALYDSQETAYLGLYDLKTGVIYYIFQSAKINTTAVRSFKSIDKSYEYITKFINDNINNFRMTDFINDLIQLIRNTPDIKQRTKEWYEIRSKMLTASEIGNAIDLGIFSSPNQLAIQKRKLLNGENDLNDAMKHGIIFEPIAKRIYIKRENNKGKRNVSLLDDLPLIPHSKYKFIGASLDAIAIVTKKSDENFITLDHLEELYKNDEVIDAYVVEIKCPYTWDSITKIKENDAYKIQVQIQMDVTGLKYGTIVNNFIKTYKTHKEYIKDKKGIYQGGVVVENDGEYYYPDIDNDISSSLAEIKEKNIPGKLIYWRYFGSNEYEVDHNPNWLESNIKKITERHEYIQKKIHEKMFEGEDPLD